jgi:hypothetical protein
MTFAATVVSRVGVWQVSDHRLSLANGAPLPNPSIKHFILECTDGKALITYAGIGVSPKLGVHVSDWLRKLLRGYKGLTVGVALEMITQAATKNIGKYHKPLTFSIGACINGDPILYGITNRCINTHSKSIGIVPRFQLMHSKLKSRNSIILTMEGTGSLALQKWVFNEFPHGKFLVHDDEVNRVYHRIRKRWNKPNIGVEFMNYLAYLNKFASRKLNTLPGFAAYAHTVSEECVTTFLHPKTLNVNTRAHGYVPTISMAVPTIARGWDITQLVQTLCSEFEKDGLQALQHHQQGLPAPEPDGDKWNELLRAQDWKPSDKF